MLRSLFSGVSGIRAHQVKMDVVGNNIVNVNTQGYKASRASFSDMFNQTLRSASAPSANLGGLNAMQVGLGVSNSSVDRIMGTGGTMTTGRMLDLAIQGDGFIMCSQGADLYYTRAGNLYLDENGYLLNPNGQYIMGLMFIDPWDYAPPTGGASPTPITLPDFPLEIEKYTYRESTGTIIQFQPNPDPNEPPEFNYSGELSPMGIPVDFSNISIGKTGIISGIDSEGNLVDIGMIPLFSFVNPEGLVLEGDNMYAISQNSGPPLGWRPGQGGAVGDIRSGALEMSNVDLSKEFTDMITTQRGYQACSRVITVSDTLLEELINLKR